jgi:hypothetical protein
MAAAPSSSTVPDLAAFCHQAQIGIGAACRARILEERIGNLETAEMLAVLEILRIK